MPEVDDVLETLTLEIAPDDFQRIQAKRAEAVARWILLADDGDFVPGTIRLGQGDPLPVELRLKGDWADHLVGDKWSFRVELQGDRYLDGMRTFSLQDPSTRTYLDEWLFMENLRDEGLLSVGYRFVRLVQNGSYKGIYALEEGFAKELFEFQGRREGLIIRYDEDLMWEYRTAYENDEMVPWAVETFYVIDDFQSGRIADDPALSKQRDVAIGSLRAFRNGTRPASQVFDADAMGKFLALCDLWGARHALLWHNLRFYYNPVTTRLEPVGFDAQPLDDPGAVTRESLDGLAFSVMTRDPLIQRAYLRHLHRMTAAGYVDALRDRYAAEHETLRTVLETEFPSEALVPPWEALARRQRSLAEMLSPYQMVDAHARSVSSETLEINVGNLLDLPVEVVALRGDDIQLAARAEWSNAEAAGHVVSPTLSGGDLVLHPLRTGIATMPYVTLAIPRAEAEPLIESSESGDDALSDGIQIATRLWGMTRTITQTVRPFYPPPVTEGPRPVPPSLADALARHPYLRPVDGETMLTMRPGTWEIHGDLILPRGYGLRLDAGTELLFGPGHFLMASGPLEFAGEEDAPVVLRPHSYRWQGIVVLDATADSHWRHTTVADTTGLAQGRWRLTGGITFYRSPIYLDHCRIVGTLAEDGLNVIESSFGFEATEFADTISDAFDADFGRGTIRASVFHDIGADGIDVSGSDVRVSATILDMLGDKALSVGEASRLDAVDLTIRGAGFGVVSKDLSHVTVRSIRIRDVRHAAFAAYIKKPAYGPATMTVSSADLGDMPPERRTLVQTESWIELEGARIWGSDLDVTALYESWQD
jgi:hypothetical protein